jgi:hypothetical protein
MWSPHDVYKQMSFASQCGHALNLRLMITSKTDRTAWTAKYLTHPQVQIDPAIPVPQWSLSPIGADRAGQLEALLGD